MTKKRTYSQMNSTKIPSKVRNPLNYSYDQIIQQLIGNKKLQLNGADTKVTPKGRKINYPDDFINQDDDVKISTAERQLAQFFSRVHGGGDLNKINMTNNDPDDTNHYNPKSKKININLLDKTVNPLTTFNHEATHGLTDIYGIPEKFTIKSLAKLEERTGRNLIDDSGYYNQGQDILDVIGFGGQPLKYKNTYPYKQFAYPFIKRDLGRLNKHSNQKENLRLKQSIQHFRNSIGDQDTGPIKNFREVHEYLKNNQYKSVDFIDAYDEFFSHFNENPNKPFNINENNAKYKEDGRVFVQGVAKGTYDLVNQMLPTFSTEYPDLNDAYLDRITQVRDYTKYPDADAYRTYFNNKQIDKRNMAGNIGVNTP